MIIIFLNVFVLTKQKNKIVLKMLKFKFKY